MSQGLINAKTDIYAILGDPIAHSLSPVIMNASFNRMKLDKVFLALKSNKQTADCIMRALRMVDLKGYVFTMPMKEIAASYLDELRDEAAITGAVNCVQNKDGRLIGYNTDSMGFWTAVREKCQPGQSVCKVFVMGMGGFAKAAVAQAALQGVTDIVVANRMNETEFVKSFEGFLKRLKEKCPNVRVKTVDWVPSQWKPELRDTDLVVNATPNGLYGKGDLENVFPYDMVMEHTIFFDAIYSPLITAFLDKARENGHSVVNGLDLLAHQGVCSFEIWTGIRVEPDVMRADAMKFLECENK